MTNPSNVKLAGLGSVGGIKASLSEDHTPAQESPIAAALRCLEGSVAALEGNQQILARRFAVVCSRFEAPYLGPREQNVEQPTTGCVLSDDLHDLASRINAVVAHQEALERSCQL